MKRLFSAMALLALLVLSAGAEPSVQQKYVEKWSATAVAEMKRSGVPASITLAQGILESSSGTSALAVKANNHFGIKCHNDWTGERYYQDDDEKNECFRVYPSAEQSFSDHSDFLRYRDRYKFLFELDPRDYKAWARGLKQAGYATNPQYASKLIKIIEDYGLYAFDEVKEIPEAPLTIEKQSVSRLPATSETLSLQFKAERMCENGTVYVEALDGDTYASIASAEGLFESEVRGFNDAPRGYEPQCGEKVYLARKKTKAAKGLDKYIVESDGESLRDISQRFGVRLSSLVSRNRLRKDYVPAEGDTILLR